MLLSFEETNKSNPILHLVGDIRISSKHCMALYLREGDVDESDKLISSGIFILFFKNKKNLLVWQFE